MIALLRGLELIEQLGCTFESNTLELIQSCNGEMEVRSLFVVIMAECFLKISTRTNISFKHCPRMPIGWLASLLEI
jgi:aspartate carbamoyltransferase catalytic subunit